MAVSDVTTCSAPRPAASVSFAGLVRLASRPDHLANGFDDQSGLGLVDVVAAVLGNDLTSARHSARQIRLQLARLLLSDGRYLEAFAAYEQVKGHEDPRIRREALIGTVKSSLRLGDFCGRMIFKRVATAGASAVAASDWPPRRR